MSNYNRFTRSNKLSNIVGWIDETIYPELDVLIKNKEIIIKELQEVIKSHMWHTFDTDRTVVKETTLLNSKKCLVYNLIINKKILPESSSTPLTIQFLKKISLDNIINVNFFCIEPYATTHRQNYKDAYFYRCHIPLIVPLGNCFLEVEGEKKIWTSKPLVFDPKFYHDSWNYTPDPLFVLVIDLIKKEKIYPQTINRLAHLKKKKSDK